MSIKFFKRKISFKEGLLSILNFDDVSDDFEMYPNIGDEEIDTLSLYNDWKVVGDDFKNAMSNYEHRTRSIPSGTKSFQKT